MGVHPHLAGRPGEEGEAAVLRSDEGQRPLLVVDELRGGEVAGAAEPGG